MISLEWVIKSLDPRPRAINIGREGCTVKLCLCVIYMDIYIYIYICACVGTGIAWRCMCCCVLNISSMDVSV